MHSDTHETRISTRTIRSLSRETHSTRLTAHERTTGYDRRPNRSNARRNAIEASLLGY